jgi:hypothetical protein
MAPEEYCSFYNAENSTQEVGCGKNIFQLQVGWP